MKILSMDRGLGKTRKLIEMAHNKDAYIVCLNRQRVKCVYKMANNLGKNILFPLTLDEYISRKAVGMHHFEFLLDDADDMVYTLIRKYLFSENVTAITSSDKIISELLSKLNAE